MSNNILLYCALSSEGGIETHIQSLTEALIKANHRVTIAAKWVHNREFYEERFIKLGAILEVAPQVPAALKRGALRSLLEQLNTIQLFWRLRKQRFDVVAIHAAGSAGRLFKYLAKPYGKTTYHEHLGGVKESLERNSYRQIITGFDFITVNSTVDLNLLKPHVQNVFLLPALTHVPQTEEIIPREPSQDKTFRIAFVGNMSAQQKGARRLWDIWASSPPLGCSLHYFGRGDVCIIGEQFPANVYVHGAYPRSKIAEVFSKIDLLVHPADDESLGLVLIEAMAFGVPFLCTAVGGMTELAANNPDAGLTTSDAYSLRSSIIEMKRRIETNEIQPWRLKERYQKNFSMSSLGSRWLEAYVIASAESTPRGG